MLKLARNDLLKLILVVAHKTPSLMIESSIVRIRKLYCLYVSLFLSVHLDCESDGTALR